ncbi:kinase-like protein [Gigaspora margarita]|uniref:Kinase-like protein n=1 Tax=Gigaspora margarita TaxID=4874 RepID=A0A8H4AEM0_GIGMA|nr:kinase-like protein [Gigaspora margarita]
MSGKEFFDVAADILTVYIPVISAVKVLVDEICKIYENAECNKELCAVMVDRVKAAEFSMYKIIRSEKKKEDFNKKSYYLAFERFKNNLTQVKEYCKNVSKLKGYKRFLHATDVKSKFDQLRDEFDRCMADLNFAYEVSNAIDRKEESQRVDKSLKEVKESLEQLDDKLDESFKQLNDKLCENFKQNDCKLDENFNQVGDKIDAVADKIDAVAQRIDYMQVTKQGAAKTIDPSDLSDPMKQDFRGNNNKVIKKLFKNAIEVACKPIDGKSENEMAILGKLGLSPQIVKFYGQSVINNSQVMILGWAEQGNLKELYEKFDIPWTRKIQIAKDILLGLLFLRTVNVFHHDVRCENVFVLRDLSVKLGNFGFARGVDDIISSNLSHLATYIVRWMAPELIKKYISSNYENKKVYTFNCEMFSYGMLLWELCYERLPYGDWNIKKISDHVLAGKREKILKGNFKRQSDNDIQLEFIKIFQDAWCHQPELRITIPALRHRLEELANKFPIPFDEPQLLRDKTLDFDGLKSEESKSEAKEYPGFDEEIPEEVEDDVAVIPLKDGIEMHKRKEYDNAWECFKQNADLNNPEAKFWVGYYLLYGHNGEKDPIQARKYFKEAADENNHAESQCRYAVALLAELSKETDETVRTKLRKEILYYFELAAENQENRNADAMYYLGDIYVAGKLKVKKDVERGVYYLKLASSNKNERANSLLKKLGK